MNWIKKWRERRQEKQRLKRLSELSKVISSFDKLKNHGLIFWNEKERRLYISEPIALFYIAQGAHRWKAFLCNLYCYLVYKQQQKQWEDHIIDCQAKVVRKRKAEVAMLTKAEVERIRRATADGISMQEVALPPIRPFEFFIIKDAVEHKAEITWVGTYNPETDILDMAEWDTVKRAIDKNKQEDNHGEE